MQIVDECDTNQPQLLPDAGSTLSIHEKDVDMGTISEPYRNHGGGTYVKAQTNQVALWVCDEKPFQEIIENPENGFIRTKVKGIQIYT